MCLTHKYTSVGGTSVGMDPKCMDGWVMKIETGRIVGEVGEADTLGGGCAFLCEGSKQVTSDRSVHKFCYIPC